MGIGGHCPFNASAFNHDLYQQCPPYNISPDSRLPRCAFRRRIKFATGRTAPDSRFPTPYST
ncbi:MULTISPECIES: hypothetical protein [unclassified Moorena]|uniref:hypothetical protein n=1 Tax=unclassified Moorena TaxID=2683338 RepID=UPI0013B9742D|nr:MULTISPECIES: hypothetical protein [unclassified Moorena]NEP37155.1 hypothetical protein [Moorena sp. SIO3B2]NEQ10815.1 hypothetical protein [Moorena sp. SIO4E2]NER87852.1 hypothetical protein [Moorena sp. SIO3A2]NET63609.1 hypothetical protein [Moorena sp. SIO1G6]